MSFFDPEFFKRRRDRVHQDENAEYRLQDERKDAFEKYPDDETITDCPAYGNIPESKCRDCSMTNCENNADYFIWKKKNPGVESYQKKKEKTTVQIIKNFKIDSGNK
ncbi:hypothetical protein A3K64_01195 [Candidatus Micrarchaeota archaeon RBG_16_36_9]|nr:MAG: hypothetical protein A3K64_01195 [Candidatus Micrarchaeota archaeon RBG_16_36_9]